MSETFGNFDEAQAQLDSWVQFAERRGEAAQRAVDRIEALTVEVWSPRREVRVVLDQSGLLTDLEFAEWAPTESPGSLGRAVQKAHDDALLKWRDAMDAIADEEYEDFEDLRTATKESAHAGLPPMLDEDNQ
ncbi:MAG TPA: hypothetical protein H9815_02020 [Candidatus Ruania gallistercoris]|uniref:YbaB/EbfC family DNA-binding protein n=1 Tax=Candidatus Ruania gallistercoris TaxID=2838746 RepID=A0A9D2EBZ8_9MICO|nr:hypothetical protein [Candidatus Ruania gallistercoris]